MPNPMNDGPRKEVIEIINAWTINREAQVGPDRKLIGNNFDMLANDIVSMTAAHDTTIRIDELEALCRKSEVVGIGYAVIREKYVIDRLASLRSDKEGK